jgi:hypothetical protein
MILEAESGGYKVTKEEIEDDQQRRGKTRESYLLGRDKSYWLKFIKDGDLDRAAILSKKYRIDQIDFIQAEMLRRKWLPN